MDKIAKVTIITVTYNAQDCLEQTILSVINQTYSNIEFIIIDGGSNDDTINIIKKYESHINLWISEKDQGIYDAMNKGINLATGDWINFMNAGDIFASNNTIQQVFDNNYLEYDYIYGDRINKDTIGLYYEKASPFFNHKNAYCPAKGVCHQSTFTKRNIAYKYKYSLKYKIAGDYEMMYNIYINNGKFLYRPIAVAIYNKIDGFSMKSFKKSVIEEAMILGVRQNIKFKLWLNLKCVKHNVSSFLKTHIHFRLKKNI